jgi:serine/threonine protein kinase
MVVDSRHSIRHSPHPSFQRTHSIDHPCIVKFHGFYEDPHSVNLVLQYCPAGDLLDYMRQFSRHYSCKRLHVTRTVLRQVASAVSYLHSVQVAHRDIKPENVLIRSTGPTCDALTCVLADFGWACSWTPNTFRKTLCGTPEYVPIEMLRGSGRYEAAYVDPWALGVLACELLHGSTPFLPSDDEEEEDSGARNSRDIIFQKIREIHPRYNLFGSSTPSVTKDFCMQLLQPPLERMSADDALQHAFLAPQQPQYPPPAQVTPTSSVQASGPTIAQRFPIFQHATTR